MIFSACGRPRGPVGVNRGGCEGSGGGKMGACEGDALEGRSMILSATGFEDRGFDARSGIDSLLISAVLVLLRALLNRDIFFWLGAETFEFLNASCSCTALFDSFW